MATDTTMVRTQIFLHAEQRRKLQQLKEQLQVDSASEAARMAIDAYDPEMMDATRLDAMLKAASTALKEAIALTRATADRLESKAH